MIGRGLLTLAIGMILIKLIIFKTGQLNDMLVFAVTFSPLWLGGAIGWSVAFGAKTASNEKKWLPSLIAAIITLPAALADPWAVVALGLEKMPISLRLLLLLTPVMVSAGLAFPGVIIDRWPIERSKPKKIAIFLLRILGSVIVIALINFLIYAVIYWVYLPPGNFVFPLTPYRFPLFSTANLSVR